MTSTCPSSSRTSGTSAPLSTPLLDRLDLDRLDGDRFRGAPGAGQHLFGGQLLAQGLLAAARCTADELRAQSLHAVFLTAGTGDRPVDYAVERLRDGSSFSNRRIVGSQDGRPVAALTAAFHRPEGEALHQAELPAVPTPARGQTGRYHSAEFESRDVTPGPGGTSDDGDGVAAEPLTLHHWSRLQGSPPADPAIIEAMVAWLSDSGPTRAGRQPHLDHPGFGAIRTTSLDHHLWFHQPADLARWHLTTLRSEATADARGLVRGTLHDETGRHIASVAQEVLVRLPPSPPADRADGGTGGTGSTG